MNTKKLILAVMIAACPAAAFAGGSVMTGGALETTQLLNNGLLGQTAAYMESQYGTQLKQWATQLETLTNAIKQYEHMLQMASQFTVLDVLGLTNFVNNIRLLVASGIELYDTLDNLDSVIESSFNGFKKNFFDLGFDSLRDFARTRRQRYMIDVYNQMKKGSAALEHFNELAQEATGNEKSIASGETLIEVVKMCASLLNSSYKELGQLYLGQQMGQTAVAEGIAYAEEHKEQESIKDEGVEKGIVEPAFEFQQLTGSSAKSYGM